MTYETLLVCCLQVGLTAADLDDYTVGGLLDIITTYNNFMSEENNDVDIDLKYEQLKQIEPFVKEQLESGEITDQEYQEFLGAIREYEDE